MEALFWNYWGLGNLRIVQALRMIVRQQDPLILFLCETKCDTTKLNLTRVSLGGGEFMWLVGWIELRYDLCILSSFPHHIDAEVGGIGEAFH
ncbi:hypothetical protein ACFX2J_046336 [Malus domestica]